ncbi:MAG TPA: type II CAAX endopeptidase family protein [Gammaproteobacteria bacterium]|jgi:hypothetical protein
MDSMIPVPNRRPGKLWVFLQYPLTRFLAAFAVLFIWIGAMVLVLKFGKVEPETPLAAMILLIDAIGIPIIYTGFVHFMEKRPVVELAAKGAQRFAARGVLVGAALFCIVMLVSKLLGAWTYVGTSPLSYAAYPFIGALFTGILEETIFRGLLFRLMEERLGSWIALAISALLFAVAHGLNPGITLVAIASIFMAGLLLGAAYMYTRSLWFVMGLHFAWNFTEGGIFATPVSGSRPQGIIAVHFTGPDLLTGGAFGAEGSLTAVVICLAAAIAFIMFARRSRRVVAPFWKKR